VIVSYYTKKNLIGYTNKYIQREWRLKIVKYYRGI